jgi:hypothetical protein
MRKNEIKLGATYVAKVSGSLTTVRLDCVAPYGGWLGTNTRTGRQVHIATAGRLRSEVAAPTAPAIEGGK